MRVGILPLEPATYESHFIHGQDRLWIETNCYVDMWIELLHAFDLDPVAPLAVTLAIDFEGDQWTFFKYPLGDLHDLYGLDVQELNVWRNTMWNIREQLVIGRPVLVEVDSFHLPDTAGTTYRTEHGKTTIAVQEVDVEARSLGYFHAQGYYRLDGDDFDRVFFMGELSREHTMLPPYAEYVKMERVVRPEAAELVERALVLARSYVARRPSENPVRKFGPRLARDIEWLKRESLAVFHQYSFATLRQCGSCFELAATFLDWLAERGVDGVRASAADFRELSTSAKTLQFKLARIAGRNRHLDVDHLLGQMAVSWDTGMERLTEAIGPP